MNKRFTLESSFPPQGDQPEAIRLLVNGLGAGVARAGFGQHCSHASPGHVLAAGGRRCLLSDPILTDFDLQRAAAQRQPAWRSFYTNHQPAAKPDDTLAG